MPERGKWVEAKKTELQNVNDRDVYELVPQPERNKVLGAKWVYAVKKDALGTIKSFKARYVAKGFRKVEGIN